MFISTFARSCSRSTTCLTFQYDHNGLRTQKVVEADWYPETTNYYLHGKLLTHMTVDYRDASEVAQQDILHFFYDAQSRPAKVSYNGTIYTYIHNLQGDVVGLLDNSGDLVVEYKYDAWGKPIAATGSLAATLGKRNPFRYRGYVYDEETGLYYLRSRYYNPVVGRFVNEDGAVIPGLLCTNLFAYCSNNPLSRVDTSGYGWNEFWQSVGNWFSDLGNKIGDELQSQLKIKTEVNIRRAKSLDENLSKAGNWIKKKASDVGKAVGDWWNGSAKPWIKQAWEDAGNYVKNAFRAQQQADILSAQMTYHAACMIAENWKEIVRYSTYVYSGGSLVVSALSMAGKLTPSPIVTATMWTIDLVLWVYGIGNDEGWW